MTLQFLGTGTSQGIPVIQCKCRACRSVNARDKRLRSSVWVRSKDQSILIDIGPDFRQQALRHKIYKVDAILLTHEHADHTAGMDDIRPINFAMGGKIPLYAERRVADDIRQRFYYVFGEQEYPGLPQLGIKNITAGRTFSVGNVKINPIRIWHGKLGILGFKIGGLVYITDARSIDDRVIENIKGCEVLVINALRNREHHSHMSLEQALDHIRRIAPGKAFLTHISHQLGLHAEVNKTLGPDIRLAYDGLKVRLSDE
ncbi:MAG TPA: MBL fold metallo-hydrolase [Saprospiraceae bacterium]|nr:MBL fold metallo-hydrolase [Saprospiraceae bacterium]